MVNYARASSQSESGKYFEWIIIIIIINFTEKYIELKRSIQHQKNLLPFCFPFAGGRMELSCGRFSQLVIDYGFIAVTVAQFLVEEVYSLVNITKMCLFFFLLLLQVTRRTPASRREKWRLCLKGDIECSGRSISLKNCEFYDYYCRYRYRYCCSYH